MLLYHVDLLISIGKGEKLTPRIPETRMKGENATIPRICLSDSPEGCLIAIGPPRIRKYSDPDLFGCEDGTLPFNLLVFDTDKLDKNSLMTPEYLDTLGFVPDAYITHEHWYTKPLKVEKIINCTLMSYDVNSEIIIPRCIRELSDNSQLVQEYIDKNQYIAIDILKDIKIDI